MSIPLGTLRRGWKENITEDLKEININSRNCLDSAQDRDYWRALDNAALNLWVPKSMELDMCMFLYFMLAQIRC